jgi:hypothetical protein
MKRVLFRRIVCAVDLSDQSVPSLKLAHLHGGHRLATRRRPASVGSRGPGMLLSSGWRVPPLARMPRLVR